MDQWNNFKTFWWMNVLGNMNKIHAQVDVRILRSSYFSYNLRNASPTIPVLIYLLYVLITVDVFVSLVKWTCLNQTFTQKWIPQYLYKKIFHIVLLLFLQYSNLRNSFGSSGFMFRQSINANVAFFTSANSWGCNITSGLLSSS